MRQLIPFVFLLFSCTTERDVVITPVEENRDIVIFPSFKEDTLEVFIPYSFKIENQALEKARLSRFRYKPNNRHTEVDRLVIDGDGSIRKSLSSKAKNIPIKSSKIYTYYLKTYENKDKIDEKYWKSFPYRESPSSDRETYTKLLTYDFNRVNKKSDEYKELQKKVANDSIAFTINYGEYFVTKVCKLNEYKFKTITLDDLLENREKLDESVFKH